MFSIALMRNCLACVALLHGSCSLGPILCPGFGSLENILSPLAGLDRRCMGALWGNAEMQFSKILSFALIQNILCNEKLSSALHPKLGENIPK